MKTETTETTACPFCEAGKITGVNLDHDEYPCDDGRMVMHDLAYLLWLWSGQRSFDREYWARRAIEHCAASRAAALRGVKLIDTESRDEEFRPRRRTYRSCADGFCGALDCPRCYPESWRMEL